MGIVNCCYCPKGEADELNELKVLNYFFKDQSENYRNSDTYQWNQMVTEQGAYGKSMKQRRHWVISKV